MTTAPTCVMIGTRETVRLLAGQLALLSAPPRVAGCVLTEPVSDSERRYPVLGTLEDLSDLQGRHGFSTALVSLPADAGSEILRVRSLLSTLGITERFVVPLTEALDSNPSTSARREGTPLDMAELIGRTPHSIDRASVTRILEGKRVLVTGAGGSIGSELVRIVATFRPEVIFLMERSENALFEIDRNLAERFPSVPRRAILHDVVDTESTLRRLSEARPHVVFHAAAHKHVPLMEDHPAHAVENNFFGTKSIADAAATVGCERFVMISSDKAVNPSSVMGATKRLAERYVQSLQAATLRDGRAETRFSMVRFGNVLGSACSVLPIWSQQISAGGPVTVTDERMTRYFMTIHEAATLVIQAAALSGGTGNAAVFVLDMGKPVRILDLAERFVRAHGFAPSVITAGAGMSAAEPGVARASNGNSPSPSPTMQIRLTGARPGEKLHEELAYAAEQLRPTSHPGINSWAGTMNEPGNSGAAIDAHAMVADLASVRRSPDPTGVLEVLRKYVPTLPPAAEPTGKFPLQTESASRNVMPNKANTARFPNSKQNAA